MGKIFGGYTDIPWQSEGGFVDGYGNSFVFSLRDNHNFVKLKSLTRRSEHYHNGNFLTSFGIHESGFIIHDLCNNYKGSNSNLGFNGNY